MIIKPQFNQSDIPLSEYPRPQFKRDSYFSLNGAWEYAITGGEEVTFYDGEITVPYSPETNLSNVNRALGKTEVLHYRKAFTLPEGFIKSRVLLNFGAVDQVCKVYVNGSLVCENKGGYLPFTADVTDYLRKDENELTLSVWDDADSDIFGRGKQRYDRGGIWYTPTSGIWQSVWLESVPDKYVKSVKLTPDYDNKLLCIEAKTVGDLPIKVEVLDENGVISVAEIDKKGALDVSTCKEWTPDSPELYTVKLYCGDDIVESYFGLRKFSAEIINGKRVFTINNKPVFHNGLLDQGYYEGGAYTPKSNEVMYNEILSVKNLGYNMLRKHIKVEPLLWYYYCDILGVLVWQDMINGGGRYSPVRIALAPFINLHINDNNYKKMKRSEQSRKQYFVEAYGLIDTLYNCVSLCLWTPFNEAWGQFDALNVWKELSSYDPTRLYDHASGWQDKGGGDLNSRHIYFRKARIKGDGKRVLALTEFGGYSLKINGHTFSKKTFGYKTFKTKEKLTQAIEKLYEDEVIPLIYKQGLCATVYTELTDVEDEINGLFTFDRLLKVDGDRIKNLNAKVNEAFSSQFGIKEQ